MSEQTSNQFILVGLSAIRDKATTEIIPPIIETLHFPIFLMSGGRSGIKITTGTIEIAIKNPAKFSLPRMYFA